VLAAPIFEVVEDSEKLVVADPTIEVLVADWGGVELAAPRAELLVVRACESVVLAASMLELVLTEDDGELLSVLDDEAPDAILEMDEVSTDESVTEVGAAEFAALETVDELVWLVIGAEFGES
jgi:hypothetical protein